MRLPAIRGIIDRRILANFRIDPECMAAALPSPFRPQVVNGYAVGGICLIRLKRARPKCLPIPWGIGSENAAHRIAVEWVTNGQTKHGVYVPRRDTNSRLNTWAGGRLFPGVQHYARFTVEEQEDAYAVTMTSDDGTASVLVAGVRSPNLAIGSAFKTLGAASEFFARGSLGYSDTRITGKFDGIELQCSNWHVESLDVDAMRSSYFEDTNRFPPGTVEFDCALLMRDIDHEWLGRPDVCCSEGLEV